jgi:hypothetical protein
MNVETPRWVPLASATHPIGRALRSAFAVEQKLPRSLNAALQSLDLNQRKRSNHMPRELIDTGTDKRFVRRNGQGQFKESDDVGRSLATDRRQPAKNKSKKGEGDRGDR